MITARGWALLSFGGCLNPSPQYYWETKRYSPFLLLNPVLGSSFPHGHVSVEQWGDVSLNVSLRWLNIQWEVWDIILALRSRMIKKKTPPQPLDGFLVMQSLCTHSLQGLFLFFFWKDMTDNNLIKSYLSLLTYSHNRCNLDVHINECAHWKANPVYLFKGLMDAFWIKQRWTLWRNKYRIKL